MTNNPPPTLVLWDIDHTLVTISGVSRKIYEAAFLRMTGQELRELADMAGRTERAILLETLALHGLERDDDFCDQFFSMLATAAQELRPDMIRRGRVLPGARAALRALAADHVVQSVVTGNIKGIAMIKLKAFGLANFINFEVGGYGDDGEERAPLIRLAIERANAKYGYEFAPKQTFIIGDTPYDVQAANFVGVRGIGVATGSSTTADDAGGELLALAETDADSTARLAHVSQRPTQVDRAALDTLAAILDQYRRLEDSIGPDHVWQPIRAQLTLAQRLLASAPSSLRGHAASVTAQYARQAGWLSIATGRRGAAALFRQTADLAAEAGLGDLEAMARSYLGHLAWIAGRPYDVVAASRVARNMPGAYLGEQAYDAVQEARGHAMLGDRRAVVELLAEHNDLAAATAEHTGPIPPWQYYRSPASLTLERGLVWAILAGRGERVDAEQAVGELGAGVAGLPIEQRGAEWVADPFLVSLAEMQAVLGDRVGLGAAAVQVRQIAASTGGLARPLSVLDRLLATSAC